METIKSSNSAARIKEIILSTGNVNRPYVVRYICEFERSVGRCDLSLKRNRPQLRSECSDQLSFRT